MLAILLLPTSLHESFMSFKALIVTVAQVTLFIYTGRIHTCSLFTRHLFLPFKNIQNLMSHTFFLADLIYKSPSAVVIFLPDKA